MADNSSHPRFLICILFLLALIVLHVIPLPILEVLMLYIMVFRPVWFKNLMDHIYGK